MKICSRKVISGKKERERRRNKEVRSFGRER